MTEPQEEPPTEGSDNAGSEGVEAEPQQTPGEDANALPTTLSATGENTESPGPVAISSKTSANDARQQGNSPSVLSAASSTKNASVKAGSFTYASSQKSKEGSVGGASAPRLQPSFGSAKNEKASADDTRPAPSSPKPESGRNHAPRPKHKAFHKKKKKVLNEGPVQTVSSVNEASHYRHYNKVQDPMENHRAYLRTHYKRIEKMYEKGGAVDCGLPDTWGRHRSKWKVYQRWNQVNIDRENYALFELFSTAKAHYNRDVDIAEYEWRKNENSWKWANAKMVARNMRERRGNRLPKRKASPKGRRNGLN